jgi:hypothetical protein
VDVTTGGRLEEHPTAELPSAATLTSGDRLLCEDMDRSTASMAARRPPSTSYSTTSLTRSE